MIITPRKNFEGKICEVCGKNTVRKWRFRKNGEWRELFDRKCLKCFYDNRRGKTRPYWRYKKEKCEID